MGGPPLIEARGLWKEYRRGKLQRPTTLRDEIAGVLRHPFATEEREERFWALRDVDLEVAAGEVVGVCGRNGAGKSTLLKILSRIVEPTRGRAILRGRLASLLEVGTGFHGDLTGRENIFLNGRLLGLSRAEVGARLDAIIAFSGVEAFIDTAVRHYSSGMQARLGFAIAAHLEPDILILDEVLTVGDARFQRRCLQRIDEIARQGRTILLVSHNMFAIEKYCSRALLLVDGQVRDNGPPRRIIEQYLADIELGIADSPKAGDEVVVIGATITTDAGPGRLRGTLTATVEMKCLTSIDSLSCGFGIYNSAAQLVANATAEFGAVRPGRQRLSATLANPGLPPGDFFLGVAAMRRGRWVKLFERAAAFRIPATVTDEQHMLERLDLAGIALEVRKTKVEAMDS